MFSELRKMVCVVLCWALVPTPMLTAQEQNAGNAPVPPQILNAHTVFVSNGGGSNYFDIYDGGANRAYNTFYSELKRTGHYELAATPSQADVIFEIRAIAPAIGDEHGAVAYNPQLILTIRDPKTNTVLWTASSNVRAIGAKKRRDRGFDQSVAVLVDKLAEVTGQPLSTAQVKAIDSNSRMPTAMKVFIVSAIAAGVALTAYGIYRINNPPKLNPPPLPAVP
jgi:hypothetical protein